MTDDPRFEILEVWRRPLGDEGIGAVRVLARIEAGAYGPDEYAVGVSVDPDSVFDPKQMLRGHPVGIHLLVDVVDVTLQAGQEHRHRAMAAQPPPPLGGLLEPGGGPAQGLLAAPVTTAGVHCS